jgi:hypothetical protein
MFGGVVKGNRIIKMYSRFRGLPSMPQGQAHVAMPNHEGGCRLLFLGECEEMGCEIATEFSIECHVDGGPAAVENRETYRTPSELPIAIGRSSHGG